MALKIEITTDQINVRSGVAKSGNAYNMREQFGYVHLGNDPYPTKIKLRLKDGQPPYMPGLYTLHDQSFYVGKYDALQINPVLVPVPAAAVKATA